MGQQLFKREIVNWLISITIDLLAQVKRASG